MPFSSWTSRSRPSSRPSTRPPTRPGSPTRDQSRPLPSDSFPTELAAALLASSNNMIPPQEELAKPSYAHSTLEIVTSQEYIYLRGTGQNVEPATLSGNVILHLAERTSIKEISLHFRGKARLPVHGTDS
jgi:hypothetical protein